MTLKEIVISYVFPLYFSLPPLKIIPRLYGASNECFYIIIVLYFVLILTQRGFFFIIAFRERKEERGGRGGQREREERASIDVREASISCLPYVPPLRIRPTTRCVP